METLLITSQFEGNEKTQTWDGKAPLGIRRPGSWRIMHRDQKLWLEDQGTSQSPVPVAEDWLDDGRKIDLGSGLTVSFRRAVKPSPVYTAVDRESYDPTSSTVSLLVYDGIAGETRGFQQIPGAFTAAAAGISVFSTRVSNGEFKIKVKEKGLAVVLKDGKQLQRQSLEPGQSYGIPFDVLVKGHIEWKDQYWWRFRQVDREIQIMADVSADDADRDNIWFRRAFATLGATFVAGMAAMYFLLPEGVIQKVQPKVETVAEIKLTRPVLIPGYLAELAQPKKIESAPPAPTVAPVQTGGARPNPIGSNVAGYGTGRSAPARLIQPDVKVLGSESARVLAKSQRELQAALGSVVSAIQGGRNSIVTGFAAPGGAKAAKVLGGLPTLAQAAKLFSGAPVYAGGGSGKAVEPLMIKNEDIGRLADIAKSEVKSDLSVRQLRAPAALEAQKIINQGHSFLDLGVDKAQVEEGLGKDEVDRVVRAQMGKIRYCHESALLYTPNLNGSLVIKFLISNVGRVTQAEIQSATVKDSFLNQCVIKTVSGFQFAKPKNGSTVTVSYPFTFKTLGGT